ncbi:hypothetical protein AAMO2058_000074000 [Amorphochlora amoebiformis]
MATRRLRHARLPSSISVLRSQILRRYLSSSGPVELSHRIAFGGKDLAVGSPMPTSDKTPMLVMHGLLGQAPNLRSFTLHPDVSGGKGAEGKERAVVRVDLRNHGNSPHSPVMTTDAMAGDLIHLMDRLGIETAVVLGHSLGGRIAMAAALCHPSRIHSLIISDVAPVQYHEHPKTSPYTSLRSILDSLMSLDLPKLSNRREAFEALAPSIPSDAIRNFALMNLDATPNQPLRWRCNLPILSKTVNNWDDFARMAAETSPYEKPTVFVRGGKSTYILPDNPGHKHAMTTMFPKHQVGCLHTPERERFRKASVEIIGM